MSPADEAGRTSELCLVVTNALPGYAHRRGNAAKIEEEKLGVDLDRYLPSGCCDVVMTVDDEYVDRVQDPLHEANKSALPSGARRERGAREDGTGQRR